MIRLPSLATYLQMNSPEEASLAFAAIPGLTVERAGVEDADTCMQLHHEVGEGLLWLARLEWKKESFDKSLASEGLYVWIAWLDREPAGFVELQQEDDRTIQITYLGVTPRFAGRGIGKHLLSFAIEEAWKLHPSKVWLRTRTYDGEYAIVNYLKRGFRICKVRAGMIAVPDCLKATAVEAVRSAKERGTYPGLLRRIEAQLRESLPWRAAARAVRLSRALLKRTKGQRRCRPSATPSACGREPEDVSVPADRDA